MSIFSPARLLQLTVATFLLLIACTNLEAIGEESLAHSNEGLEFSHPLISNSPSPETKIRLDYLFLDVDGEVEDEELGEEGEGPSKFKESTIRLGLEYAFNRNISLEAEIPYTFLNADNGPNENNFNNIEVGLKLATFLLEEYGVILGGGIKLGLPTGDDSKGIGSDNIFEIEPFADFGVKIQDFELVGFLTLGFPVNQNRHQDEGDELKYNLSMLYPLGDIIEILLEFDGLTVLNGHGDGESVLNIDPGIKVAPFNLKQLVLGFGAGFPLTNDEEFEYRLIGSIFYFFHTSH